MRMSMIMTRFYRRKILQNEQISRPSGQNDVCSSRKITWICNKQLKNHSHIDMRVVTILKRNPHLQVPMEIMTRFSTRIKNKQTPGSSSSQHDDYDIVWSGIFLCLGSDDGKKDRIAHLEDLYENEKGDKMAKVRWFVFCDEIEGRFPKK